MASSKLQPALIGNIFPASEHDEDPLQKKKVQRARMLPRPLMFSQISVFRETHLKVNIWKAAPSTEGPMDLQYRLSVFVRNDEFRRERVPLLHNIPHCVTRGSLHLQLREESWERRV